MVLKDLSQFWLKNLETLIAFRQIELHPLKTNMAPLEKEILIGNLYFGGLCKFSEV